MNEVVLACLGSHCQCALPAPSSGEAWVDLKRPSCLYPGRDIGDAAASAGSDQGAEFIVRPGERPGRADIRELRSESGVDPVLHSTLRCGWENGPRSYSLRIRGWSLCFIEMGADAYDPYELARYHYRRDSPHTQARLCCSCLWRGACYSDSVCGGNCICVKRDALDLTGFCAVRIEGYGGSHLRAGGFSQSRFDA